MGWRDSAKADHSRVAASTIDDGETMTVEFLDDGEETETEAGEAVEFRFKFIEGTDDFTDMNDEPLEEGEEYILLTSSSRLLYGLASVADSLSGTTVEIAADGTQDSFQRTYDVAKA